MSTNYGHGEGPEDRDRTTASSGTGSPTEPIRGANPTEPFAGTTTGEPANSEDDAARQRHPRVGTIVWGLIVIALAVVLILAELATLSLDTGQVIIGLLIGAGLALVVGGVISASNREKDDKHP